MNDFNNLMNDLGVKPIKNNKRVNDKKMNDEKMNDEKMNDEKMNDEKMNDEKMNDEYEFRKKLKKEDISNSFEEALKLYNPKIDDYDDFKGNKNNKKTIFHEIFSIITEEQIMHTIDLHGETLDKAIIKVKKKIIWCYKEKFQYILIITGKGNHSDNGPILKIGIKNLLINMNNLIDSIEYAPKYLGGEGAYVVKINL